MTLEFDLVQDAPAPGEQFNGAQRQRATSLPKSKNAAFSSRQADIVQLVAQGLSDKEIGQKLHLTEGTVGWHLKKIFLKCGVHNRVALAARFLREASPKRTHSALPPSRT